MNYYFLHSRKPWTLLLPQYQRHTRRGLGAAAPPPPPNFSIGRFGAKKQVIVRQKKKIGGQALENMLGQETSAPLTKLVPFAYTQY